MFEMKSVEDLWEHIAYVLGSAPDRFPVEDFLSEDQQMNLDRAFDQLRQGVEIAYPEDSFSEKRKVLNQLLDQSYSAYLAGDEVRAGHLLNDFQDNIFKREDT